MENAIPNNELSTLRMWDIFMRREKITEFITFYLFQLMDMRTLVE